MTSQDTTWELHSTCLFVFLSCCHSYSQIADRQTNFSSTFVSTDSAVVDPFVRYTCIGTTVSHAFPPPTLLAGRSKHRSSKEGETLASLAALQPRLPLLLHFQLPAPRPKIIIRAYPTSVRRGIYLGLQLVFHVSACARDFELEHAFVLWGR